MTDPNRTQRLLEPTDIRVGPCAWSLSMLAGPQAAHARAHPSLVVAWAWDEEELLARAAPNLADLPVMLTVSEPEFSRRLPEVVERRMAALDRTSVDALVVWARGEATDLKGGHVMQTLHELRERGRARHVGLGHDDVLAVEWMARRTSARLLAFDYDLDNQAAAWRLLDTAREFGMACVARVTRRDEQGVAFSLRQGIHALPVFDAPIPAHVQPMSHEQARTCVQAYQSAHQAPPPLPRGGPVMDG